MTNIRSCWFQLTGRCCHSFPPPGFFFFIVCVILLRTITLLLSLSPNALITYYSSKSFLYETRNVHSSCSIICNSSINLHYFCPGENVVKKWVDGQSKLVQWVISILFQDINKGSMDGYNYKTCMQRG